MTAKANTARQEKETQSQRVTTTARSFYRGMHKKLMRVPEQSDGLLVKESFCCSSATD